MTTLVVHPATKPLVGQRAGPVGQEHRAPRAALRRRVRRRDSRIRGFSHGEDNVSTANALRAMGIVIDEPSPTELVVHGKGLHGLRGPERDLDCGNSGTTMRLIVRDPGGAALPGDARRRRDALAAPDDARRWARFARVARSSTDAGTRRARGRLSRRSSSGRCPRDATSRASSTRARCRARRSRAPSCSPGSMPTAPRASASPACRATTPSACSERSAAPFAPWARWWSSIPRAGRARCRRSRSRSPGTSRRRRSCSSPRSSWRDRA